MIGRTLAFLLPLVAITAIGARDAAACGGCFVPPDANTQVTGHRMVLSVSPTETTLWDQIAYSGDPGSFAWVLPIKGVVEVGVSSDLLFNTLAFLTDPQIIPPSLNCPYTCEEEDELGGSGGGGGAGGGGDGSGGGGVEVIAQQVVGPYETVQLSASDPAALQSWLASHGYAIPGEIAPIIDTYVAENFDFLAMKLVPGQGIDSMKPVRITTPGAAPVLPLRMVAAGTGAITPITLWVIGEGRYEPSNFGQFTIALQDVVWNWDTSSSNYAVLKKQGLEAGDGSSWLIESAAPESAFAISNIITMVIDLQPWDSGYGEPDGTGATEEAVADLDALYGAIDTGSMWLTRMHAQLPRPALGVDLGVTASMDQSSVPNEYHVAKTTGTTPVCPPDPCAGETSSSSASGAGAGAGVGAGAGGAAPGGPGDPDLAGGCALGRNDGMPAFGALALGVAIALARRRRSQPASAPPTSP